MADKEYKNILIEREGNVTFLWLNRPDKRNAMSPDLHFDMDDALDWLATDKETKVLVLGGKGEAWCAGQDLRLYFRGTQDNPEMRYKANNAYWSAEKAMEIAKDCGDTATELLAMVNLSGALRELGERQRSDTLLDDARAAVRRSDDRLVWSTVSFHFASATSNRGQYVQAIALYEEALSFARETGDKRLAITALRSMAVDQNRLGDTASARASLEEAALLARAAGAQDLQARILNSLGVAAQGQSDFASALKYLEEVVELARQLRNPMMEKRALAAIGYGELCCGELNSARETLERARLVETDVPVTDAVVLDNLGLVALARGDLEAANAHLRAAVESRRSAPSLQERVFSLTSMAALLARCERMKEAASVAAAAMHACEATGLTLDAYTSGLVQAAVASARQSTPAAEFDAAWSMGLSMSVDDALSLALQA